MLRGIDVSGYQALSATYSHPNVETAYSGSDFVIAKATQGTQPMNRYMTAQLQRALADGKLIGVYHYAEGGSPVAEADAFVACVSGYIGKALLCLDWENGDNDAWGSTVWARQFVDRVYAKTGIYPVVYTYPAGRPQVASCADVSRLWIAGYPDNRFSWNLPEMIYNTGTWSDWTIWQYSSAGGTVDLDVAKLTYAEWEQLAQGESKFEPHWVKNSTGWWYATSPSAYYYSQWAFINGSWYYFDARGYAVTGWYFDGADWFYLCPEEGPQECAMLTGMQHIGSYDYYFANDGRMATGIFDAEGKKYLASENGNLLSAGVHVHNDHAYAVNADGSVQADSTVQVDTDEAGRLTSLH
uniref:lysozyme n=1 Tax=Siphoviridae sp. ctYkG6 TaxID=2825551 RepID=A0A8S5VCB0_9CAUD|nr:MAG TPA: LysA like endolysin [Siphoviridae sp. ctYkG6]